MSGVSNAVFLSYASEDTQAAERIATALRGTRIEVWFDKSELRGAEAWDQSIRRQIKNCALFIPSFREIPMLGLKGSGLSGR